MKLESLLLGATLCLSVGCAAAPTHPASDSYLDHKTLEVQRLERRVAELDRLSADANRKYRGSHESLVALDEEQRQKLALAREDLKALKEGVDNDAAPRMARLNDNLDDMRTTLNLMVAE